MAGGLAWSRMDLKRPSDGGRVSWGVGLSEGPWAERWPLDHVRYELPELTWSNGQPNPAHGPSLKPTPQDTLPPSLGRLRSIRDQAKPPAIRPRQLTPAMRPTCPWKLTPTPPAAANVRSLAYRDRVLLC
ncbi:uncharacterized protein A4U43_C01F14730 [Asparagus officinalis]|uniref:Uncharacterized protein n=1 Tax=Asparagus officinalis TaxID=4686 RepID=A0A5P1FPD4_ASPOF|nr:uncharacterized protein A4U43_C01F14730 [Asparagus officinalis]